ncbi:MAG: TetR/AcrR family transcriptional regulator [Acidimicrobiia bacterium]|nr:TetR/AcrR family transcriptional regulator [Acidimicrobiia bacterium]
MRAIDAFIDLVLEHHGVPRPEVVAERAGVSIATFYRYFATLDELRREAATRILDRFPGLYGVPDIGTGTRADRIARFAAARVGLHEALHPLELVLRSDAVHETGAAELVDFARRALADQVRLHFDAELGELTPARREDTVAAIAVLTSVESWEQFRRSHDRKPARIRRAWTEAIDRLLPEH